MPHEENKIVMKKTFSRLLNQLECMCMVVFLVDTSAITDKAKERVKYCTTYIFKEKKKCNLSNSAMCSNL